MDNPQPIESQQLTKNSYFYNLMKLQTAILAVLTLTALYLLYKIVKQAIARKQAANTPQPANTEVVSTTTRPGFDNSVLFGTGDWSQPYYGPQYPPKGQFGL